MFLVVIHTRRSNQRKSRHTLATINQRKSRQKSGVNSYGSPDQRICRQKSAATVVLVKGKPPKVKSVRESSPFLIYFDPSVREC
jgi:hypothetical protein